MIITMISLTLLALKAKYFTFYLYMWLKDKPQLEPMVLINLPKEVFFYCGKKEEFEVWHQPSPTGSELSIVHSSGKNNLVASIHSKTGELDYCRPLFLPKCHASGMILLC